MISYTFWQFSWRLLFWKLSRWSGRCWLNGGWTNGGWLDRSILLLKSDTVVRGVGPLLQCVYTDTGNRTKYLFLGLTRGHKGRLRITLVSVVGISGPRQSFLSQMSRNKESPEGHILYLSNKSQKTYNNHTKKSSSEASNLALRLSKSSARRSPIRGQKQGLVQEQE